MRFLLALSFLIVLFSFTAPADAGEVVACGAPTKADMITQPYDPNYCNFYDRQIAYREEKLKQAELIRQRQEIYAAPRRAAREQYEKQVEAMNAQRGSSAESADESAEAAPEQEMELQMMLDAEEQAKQP